MHDRQSVDANAVVCRQALHITAALLTFDTKFEYDPVAQYSVVFLGRGLVARTVSVAVQSPKTSVSVFKLPVPPPSLQDATRHSNPST